MNVDNLSPIPKRRAEGLGPKPPKMGGKKGSSRKRRVNEHEEELADKLGGYRQPQSGAFAAFKGDIKLEDFLLDSKETEHSSIIVSYKDIVKITREAHQAGKMPGLVLTIKKMPPTIPTEYVLTSIDDFAILLERIRDLEQKLQAKNSEETGDE